MNTQLPKDLFTELCDDHWQHEHNWNGLNLAKVADRHQCSVEYVRRVMREIEKRYPKPKQSNAATCKTCGAPIVYLGEHACNPPVLKGISADGSIQSFRQPHRDTCPQKWHGTSGVDAAVGE